MDFFKSNLGDDDFYLDEEGNDEEKDLPQKDKAKAVNLLDEKLKEIEAYKQRQTLFDKNAVEIHTKFKKKQIEKKKELKKQITERISTRKSVMVRTVNQLAI